MVKDFNTAIVASALVETQWGHDVHVQVLDGEDESHTFVIDRPAAALALLKAADAYLTAYVRDTAPGGKLWRL